MKLGSKIILSFFSISVLIAAVGIISQRYTNSIRSQLITNNVETTRLVNYTSEMERGLYQSLIFLNGIKESKQQTTEITLDEPTVSRLRSQFYQELVNVDSSIDRAVLFLNEAGIIDSTTHMESVDELIEKFLIYKSISENWLDLFDEDQDQARMVYNTTISPYFRNQIIPVVSLFRDQVIKVQNVESQLLWNRLEKVDNYLKLLTLISILLSLLIAFYIYRSIANPLIKFNASVNKIGDGDLDERIYVNNKDEIGELADAFNKMAKNLKNRTIARDYLDNIIESIQETLIVTDAEGYIVGINKAGTKLLHYDKKEAIGLHKTECYNTEDYAECYEKNKGTEAVFEFGLISKRGNKIPVLFSESMLINNENEVVGQVVVATDITKRKEADKKIRDSLKEKDVLLSEIHHRVKNNLAVISGILQLQGYKTKNKKVIQALSESQARIQSMSIVHEMLYQSDSLAYIEYDLYVKDLIQAISSMHLNIEKNIDIITDIDSFSLDVNLAIPFSLLLNEILVNCYKHAFSDIEQGFIKVQIKEKDGYIRLIVEDNGVGIIDEDDDNDHGESLGLTLVDTLTRQLHGEYRIENVEEVGGSRTTVEFSINR